VKLWISAALTPYGNEYGLVAVVGETREEAIAKASAKLKLNDPANYVPDQLHARALLNGLYTMREIEDAVFIDWEAARSRH
jgi:hypothetical protein